MFVTPQILGQNDIIIKRVNHTGRVRTFAEFTRLRIGAAEMVVTIIIIIIITIIIINNNNT